jgi:hypothetical protein
MEDLHWNVPAVSIQNETPSLQLAEEIIDDIPPGEAKVLLF